jgi:mono/diheme cytochrome c family protein
MEGRLMHVARFVLSAVAVFCIAQAVTAEDFIATVRPFLKDNCYTCHGPDEQRNDVRFDTLGADISDQRTLEVWQDVLDQLNLGEMPPYGEPQPEEKEAGRVIELLTARLKAAYAAKRSTGRETVIRRLNKLELRNTLRDLLYLQGPDFHPANSARLVDNSGNGSVQKDSSDLVGDFPPDEAEHGFDNIGQRLVMSDFLLKLVITAAEDALRRATWPEETPELKTRRYAGHICTGGPRFSLQAFSREAHPDFDAFYQRYREPGASTGGMGRIAPDDINRTGVGLSARYRITIEASAHHQKHPWGELLASRQDEPLLLGLHMADARKGGGLNEGNPTSTMLTQWALPGDGQRRTFTYETWLDERYTPWLGWENAPYRRGLRPSQLVENYLPKRYRQPPPTDAPKEVQQAYEPDMARALFEAGYQGPHIRVYCLAIEPLVDEWPPQSHRFIYGTGEGTLVDDLLHAFANRAYRAPIAREDVKPYIALYQAQRDRGRPRSEALRDAYTAILASPRFYYLIESPGRLGSYELASRLSYFLWSSMPDEELFALAAADQLKDPQKMLAQVERMLRDSKAEAFTHHFVERWLRLDKLGSMPPAGGFYWHRQMEPQMRAQTVAYFDDLVQCNGPIRDLIDSDYTFLNERMAWWLYDRDDVWGDGFRKVPTNDPRRGGIFTQPSVMTATANGVDTSPVVRGVWVLENILGAPPAPPPPNVQPLAPDLRGAITIREQLARHREDASCASCHRKIDPMGFPFENFGPLGKWREVYQENRLKIDPSATLPTGDTVEDILAFKQILLKRETQITRCLTEKLLTYATGRTLEPADRGEVDRIVEQLERDQGGIRDLIKLVVQSEIFLTK